MYMRKGINNINPKGLCREQKWKTADTRSSELVVHKNMAGLMMVNFTCFHRAICDRVEFV